MITPTRLTALAPTLTAGQQQDIDLARAALSGEYEIVEEIGRGGMAIVYRARDRALGRDVAIKILPVQFTFDKAFVERFQREARIAAQLEHPNIIPIHRVAQSGAVSYLVMKLVRGESLAGVLRSRGTLPPNEIRRILIEAASALGHAAKHGIVHRDVKPDNIMIDEGGRYIVTDFGIARSGAEVQLTATGMSMGTPRYMSPEQARAKGVDGRSDLYSLGIVGYECLVGSPPFAAADAMALLMDHINSAVPRPSLRTDEERELYSIIERLLAKKPIDRFQSAGDLIIALGGASSANGDASRRSGTGTPPLSPTRPMPAIAAHTAITTHAAITVHAVMNAATRFAGAQRPRALRLRTAVATRAAQVTTYAASRSRRFWASAAAMVGTTIGGYYAVHFATMHGTRCPSPVAATAPSVTGTRNPEPAARQPFSLLVDPVSARTAGGDLDVYYDVCGIDAETAYSVAIRVARTGSVLTRILGTGVAPITASFDEVAGGPAVRRHRTLDIDDMPAGSYKLAVSVTDAAGRRRDREVEFQLR